jgi:hypothetical protein
MKCKVIESIIEKTRYKFFHIGKVNKLSFSLRELVALNISMVTNTESDIVVARFAISLTNISQPISGNKSPHL